MLKHLTLIYPYYENPGMLHVQLAYWYSYPADFWKRLGIIIIDDGSPRNPAKPILQGVPFPISLYKVEENIPWNQHGARNLGAWVMPPGWGLWTDIDMVFPLQDMRKILDLDVDKNKYYTFERVKMPERSSYKYHCNTVMLTKDAYWAVGGYDERFCGTYGGDGPFKHALDETLTEERLVGIYTHYYPRGYLTDAGTNDWERQGEYKDKYKMVGQNLKNIRKVGPMNFKWSKVELL